jgi:hypothetical protein
MKKIHETRIGQCAIKIYFNREYDEYQVKTVIGGKVVGGRDGGGYFTNDKKDARQTAASMARALKKRPVCRRG